MDITSFPGELLWCMCGLGMRLQLEEWTAVPHIVLNMCSTLLPCNTHMYSFVAGLIPRMSLLAQSMQQLTLYKAVYWHKDFEFDMCMIRAVTSFG